MKELHRLPPLPQDQTSAQARYLTATTIAAQRLRALGLSPLGSIWFGAARLIGADGRGVLPIGSDLAFVRAMLQFEEAPKGPR